MNTKRNIPFSPPDISEAEIAAVGEVLRSGWITTGPQTKLFEKKIAEYTASPRAVCLNSATAALELALYLLGIGEGDEVIVPAYTYTASASVIYHRGAKAVMVDCAPDSYEMDLSLLEASINERTKAILPVDLAGLPCHYDDYFRIAEAKRTLFRPRNERQERLGRPAVIADAAHAFGASADVRGIRTKVGAIADFTAFSFHAVKNLTTAEGGALTWSKIWEEENEELYRESMLFSLHGQNKDALSKAQVGAWAYDIMFPGYKCNMTDIMAAIGLEQLKRFPELLRRREEITRRYDAGMEELGLEYLKHESGRAYSTRHLYMIRVPRAHEEERNALITRLGERGISCNVHYKPLPLLTAYKKLGFDVKDYPRAFARYENMITLPLHTKLSDADAEYVLDGLRKEL